MFWARTLSMKLGQNYYNEFGQIHYTEVFWAKTLSMKVVEPNLLKQK
ncbi:26469_t:CDS:2 [Dentiscutata erythropus]|uniref:26469_t:CDS:1 n=1 Tax=Dentiscutata erythropus TaxID=1348616 RepID=A0A9N9D5J7_9GLOM|nr:26469_t:CDS:2 [Dentiscutata erythropus]